jgi:hypothetical protein
MPSPKENLLQLDERQQERMGVNVKLAQSID